MTIDPTKISAPVPGAGPNYAYKSYEDFFKAWRAEPNPVTGKKRLWKELTDIEVWKASRLLAPAVDVENSCDNCCHSLPLGLCDFPGGSENCGEDLGGWENRVTEEDENRAIEKLHKHAVWINCSDCGIDKIIWPGFDGEETAFCPRCGKRLVAIAPDVDGEKEK